MRLRRRVRTPTVLQMEAVECGAAALGIVLGWHGRHVPLAQLREECGVSRDGSKALNIVKAARRYGLVAKGWKKELEGVKALEGPFIVFWNFNHFLVVEEIAGDRVWLNDPATGPRRITLKEFDAGYTGVVITCEPGPGFRKGGEAPSTVAALRSRLSGFGTALAFGVLASILLVIPGLAAPAFTKVFVDQVLVERMHHWLRPLIFGLAIVAVAKALLTHLQLLALRRLSVGLASTMSGRFLWHVLRLPVEFYAQRFAGEISSRARVNDRVAQVLSGKLTRTAIDATTIVLYAIVMLTFDAVLTGVVLAFSLVNVLVLKVVSRRRADAQMKLAQELGKVEGIAIAGLQGMETIKASSDEASFFQRWAGSYTKAIGAQQELAVPSLLVSALPNLLTALSTAALLSIGGLRVLDGHLTLGDLVAFQSLMTSFQAPVSSLLELATTLQELRADLARLDDVLLHPIDPRTDERQGIFESGSEAVVRLHGRVELRNVTFGYSRTDEPLIRGFDLRIEPGQRIALVGGSGSGKSTIARLVTGLYEPWEGEILFDGKPARDYPRVVLTTSIAMVEQDVVLFAGTVRENLTLWDETVTHADLVRACEDAEIADVVRQLPRGYDAELLEGGQNLSGGQRQRLEIARALVYRPAVLVLDEATSALDSETERRVDRNLRQRGCTSIIIAHRLSTIRDCDQIIVLSGGKVVQRGTHAQLWADHDGEYADLIRAEGEALEA